LELGTTELTECKRGQRCGLSLTVCFWVVCLIGDRRDANVMEDADDLNWRHLEQVNLRLCCSTHPLLNLIPA
jgi:hypothetical protein